MIKTTWHLGCSLHAGPHVMMHFGNVSSGKTAWSYQQGLIVGVTILHAFEQEYKIIFENKLPQQRQLWSHLHWYIRNNDSTFFVFVFFFLFFGNSELAGFENYSSVFPPLLVGYLNDMWPFGEPSRKQMDNYDISSSKLWLPDVAAIPQNWVFDYRLKPFSSFSGDLQSILQLWSSCG